jgi:hypothetical protein
MLRTTLTVCVICGVLLGGTASYTSAAPGPLRIVGKPALVYSQRGEKSKSVTYAFQTNRRLSRKWALYISGMYPMDVNEGSSGTCYSGEFGVGTDVMENIYRALRPGKLLTFDVREGKPSSRRARRGVRVQRASNTSEAGRLVSRACRP